MLGRAGSGVNAGLFHVEDAGESIRDTLRSFAPPDSRGRPSLHGRESLYCFAETDDSKSSAALLMPAEMWSMTSATMGIWVSASFHFF